MARRSVCRYRFQIAASRVKVQRSDPSHPPVSVVLLQLDGLGHIRDRLGRAAGDETLRMVATILLHQTRGINVVSRYDGGLFAILKVETSRAGAQLYVDRVRHFLPSAGVHRCEAEWYPARGWGKTRDPRLNPVLVARLQALMGDPAVCEWCGDPTFGFFRRCLRCRGIHRW